MNKVQKRFVLALSFCMAVLIGFSSYTAIFTPGFYSKESPDWQLQSIGQDYINLLFIIPFLISTAILVFDKKRYGFFLWAGCILYIIYTYLIYCFNIHFNIFFLEYCAILGLGFYQFIYILPSQIKKELPVVNTNSKLIKTTGTYFIIISVLFFALWLSEIIPAVSNHQTPKSLIDTGLSTNPVHILDLSFFLPGVFITGILLLKGKKKGLFFTPILLGFFILMSLTIGVLALMAIPKPGQSFIAMVVLLITVSFVLLILNIRNLFRRNHPFTA